jgi:hypothetical protein
MRVEWQKKKKEKLICQKNSLNKSHEKEGKDDKKVLKRIQGR